MLPLRILLFLGLLLNLPIAAHGQDLTNFPTISKIDFSAFPRDPGPCAGKKIYHISLKGKDSYPGTSTQPFRTVVRGIKAAQSGDAVIVHSGTYSEGEEGEHRSLVLQKANLSLCAAPGESVTVVPRNNSFNYGMHIQGSNALVDGINLSGFRDSLITLGGEGTLKNIVLKNLNLSASGNGSKDGIASYDAQVNGLLLKNISVKNAFIGIQCNRGPCRNWRLDRVTVINDRGQGDTGSDGIAIENGDNLLFSNLTVTGAAGDGIDVKGTRIAVFNANVHDNSRNGVKFWRGGDLVNSLVVNHGADAAVVFDGAGDYRILNSLIAYENYPKGGSYTMTVGYDRQSDKIRLSIINSVFFNNSGALWVSPHTDLTVKNSLFTNTLSGEIFAKGETSISNEQAISALSKIATASGNKKVKAAGMFVNPPKNFSFKASSPLRDSGIKPTLFPAFDFRGQPRVRGKAPDMGPYELF